MAGMVTKHLPWYPCQVSQYVQVAKRNANTLGSPDHCDSARDASLPHFSSSSSHVEHAALWYCQDKLQLVRQRCSGDVIYVLTPEKD